MIPVAVLGATGMVGQRFLSLLENHPEFTVTELGASSRSAGRSYEELAQTRWKQGSPFPEEFGKLIVREAGSLMDSPIIFSGLDSSVAGPIEEAYAKSGHFVISNSKNHRMDPHVPIVIPEVNSEHLQILQAQGYAGGIVTNSNCSTMFLALVLAPLHRAFGVEAVQVTTMQAVSGSGYPGVPSWDILGNVIPYIAGEEEKMESETQKILGKLEGDSIVPAPIQISAQCNRVAVLDGHTETLSIKFRGDPSPDQVKQTLAGFTGFPQAAGLPSAPKKPIVLFEEEDRPQPTRQSELDGGMVVSVGRIRPCQVLDVKMVILGHNTIRGAAGAAILNAETMVAKKMIPS
jgi:aspartate-semialdehyde dehydrogenase